MARRRHKSPLRWLLPLGAAAVIAMSLWINRPLVEEMLQLRGAGSARDANEGKRVRISGKLETVGPAHDGELGIGANAAVMIRKVEMFQWHEHCNGDDCSYTTAWSQQPIDSRRFRHPEGHENPRPRLRNAVFAEPGLRVGEITVPAELVAAQAAASDFPVHVADLPANLAATFIDADGVLYAGGDPAHPQVGAMRVSYRIVPGGNVDLEGVRRGSALSAQ